MSDPTRLTPDEVQDLLVRRATEGLDADDQRRYDALAAVDPALAVEAERYELAAAAADVALLRQAGTLTTLPAHLRGGLAASAELPAPAATTAGLKLTGTSADPAPAQATQPSLLGPAVFGWIAAAAALVALGFVLMQPPKVVERIVEVPVERDPDTKPTLDEQYADLADADGTVRAAWGYNPDGGDARFADASGEVIFNADQQAGYMKLTGLPANDPTAEQYQLWIVDATRGSETTDRIDGGVFDVTAQGEVIIPIDAKIDAEAPVVFAITVEKPGGVVVSKGPLHVVAVVE